MFRRQLKNKKPPVLFYSGDISLANMMGIGVVGSRDITEDGMQFTEALVEKAVDEKLVVYSGGAKGVDVTSQTAALNRGGAVCCRIYCRCIVRKNQEKVYGEGYCTRKAVAYF